MESFEVIEKNGIVTVKTYDGDDLENVLIHDGKRIAINAPIEHAPPGGVLIVKSKPAYYMMDKLPPAVLEQHGMKHYLADIEFNEEYSISSQPTFKYITSVGNKWFTATLSKNETTIDTYLSTDGIECSPNVLKEGLIGMDKIIFNDYPLNVRVVHDKVVFHALLSDGVVKVTAPVEEYRKWFKKEVTEEDIRELNVEYLFKFPPHKKHRVIQNWGTGLTVEVGNLLVSINFTTKESTIKQKVLALYDPDGDLMKAIKEDLTTTIWEQLEYPREIKNPTTFDELVNFIKSCNVPTYAEIKKELKDLILELSTNSVRIISPRGWVFSSGIEDLEKMKPFVSYVIGETDYIIPEFKNNYIKVDAYDKNVTVDHKRPYARIGDVKIHMRTFGWSFSHPKVAYAEENADDFPFFNGKSGVMRINEKTLMSPQATEKLKKGESVTIDDFLPGAPKDTTIKYSILDTIVTWKFKVGRKQIELMPHYVKDGLYAIIPYVEGLYLLLIPYNNTIDVWSAPSITNVPEEYIVKPILETNLSTDDFDDPTLITNLFYDEVGISYFIGDDAPYSGDREMYVRITKGNGEFGWELRLTDRATNTSFSSTSRELSNEGVKSIIHSIMKLKGWADKVSFVNMI